MTTEQTPDEVLKAFFETVVTTTLEPDQTAFLRIVCGEVLSPEELVDPGRTRKMMPYYYRWPEELDQAIADIRGWQDSFDVYFTAYLYKTIRGTKDLVLPTRTIQADLDGADIRALPIAASVLVETSPRRYQGYFVLRETRSISEHEQFSQRVSHAIPDCDVGGWSLGHLMRVPTTLSHKRDRVLIKIVEMHPDHRVDTEEIERLPTPTARSLHIEKRLLSDLVLPDIGVEELMNKYGKKVNKKSLKYLREVQQDRSEALWALECACYRAGMLFEEVYLVAQASVNNKFRQRLNGAYDLLRDVANAEQAVTAEGGSIKEKVLALRDMRMPTVRKNRAVYDLVVSDMTKSGRFIHTYEGTFWYLPFDTGRPIALTRHSEQLDALLSRVYGLNATEKEQHFIVADLLALTASQPQSAYAGTLAHYDPMTGTILLHTGRKDVLCITANKVTWIQNGEKNVLFQWDIDNDPINPKISQAAAENVNWRSILFDHVFENVVGYHTAQGEALLAVFVLFLLMRTAASSRPVLAMLGPPGSGKTTLLKRLYRLIYGTRKDLSSIRTPDRFDQDVIHNPFVCFDNVDTTTAWLPDSLALSAGLSDITARKLYTDADKVRTKRQAVVGISAHNPRFGRSDVVDRMLMFQFTRIEKEDRIADLNILQKIDEQRDLMWGAIVRDLQKILAVPAATLTAPPSFRVQDFATIGWRVAHGLACAPQFQEALDLNVIDQNRFVLEEETMLLAAISALARAQKRKNGHAVNENWQTTHALWMQLETLSGEPLAFRKQYPDAPSLGRKLKNIEHQLKDMYVFKTKIDSDGVRRWQLGTRA